MIQLKTAQRLHEAAEKVGHELPRSEKIYLSVYGRGIELSERYATLDNDISHSEEFTILPAYTTDELLALLPDRAELWKFEGTYFSEYNLSGVFDGDTPSEALTNLYEYLILNGYMK